MIAASLLIGTPFFIVFGALSDKIGRKKIIMTGCLLAVLTYFPLFHALTHYANPPWRRPKRPPGRGGGRSGHLLGAVQPGRNREIYLAVRHRQKHAGHLGRAVHQ